MRFDVDRLPVLRPQLDAAALGAVRRRAPRENARKSAVRGERRQIGITELIEQRAVGVQRFRLSRHDDAEGQQIEQSRLLGCAFFL